MRIWGCRFKNVGVAGYAEAFRPVQSDSQTSEWYSYFENDVLAKIMPQNSIENYFAAFSLQSSLKLVQWAQGKTRGCDADICFSWAINEQHRGYMNMNKKLEGHPISKVDPGSIGEELEL